MLTEHEQTHGVYLFLFENLDSRCVNSNGNITDHTIPDIFAVNWDNRNKRAVSTLGILRVDRILGIGSAIDLGMRCIGLCCHDILLKLLIEVDLSSAHGVSSNDCPVLSGGPVSVDLDVNVDCTLDVET